METKLTEPPIDGPDFDDAFGLAAQRADELIELLPKIRANPSADDLWDELETALGSLALGLREIGVAVTQQGFAIEQLKAHLKLS